MTIETIFYTQIASIISFIVALFVLYRVLVKQKDATIEVQKTNIAYLKDQLTDAKSKSPDLIAQSLSGRIKLFEEELKRLAEDKSSTQEQVAAKEAELRQARAEAEELTVQVVHARKLLSDFLCPECGAPMVERAYHSESVEYQGREIDVDHEYVSFECGHEVVDGEVRSQCKHMAAKAQW